jgi:Cu(I)/Ag(I) efflux system membrane fusion protein
VRLELANPGQRLKAGMSGQITLKGNEQPALLVPSEAVIRTGKRALAYVVDGPASSTPWRCRWARRSATTRGGLEAGQQVVASAQFLIDSEASLRGCCLHSPCLHTASQWHGEHGASAPRRPANAFTVRGVIEDVAHRADAGARGRASPQVAGHDHGLQAGSPPRRGPFGSAAGAIHLLQAG